MSKAKREDVLRLIEIYKCMNEKQLQDEIDATFDIVYALLEVTESDSIEMFPNTNIRLKISCEVLKNEGRFYC